MMHELTFNELVAESQWKLQSDKITEKKREAITQSIPLLFLLFQRLQ